MEASASGAHRRDLKSLQPLRPGPSRRGARSGDWEAAPVPAERLTQNVSGSPKLGCPTRGAAPAHFPCTRGAGLRARTPHLQEVAALAVDGDQVVGDGDELLGLADEEGSAVQLRPLGGEGELALEAQHVQAP